MKYLCLFAHPDDEVIGGGGTINLLANQGDKVVVVLATDGGAGMVNKAVKGKVKQLRSLSTLRRKEFKKSCQILGISESEILDFEDGEITNKTVWGKLTLSFVEIIDKYKPDVVITFDHSGWYFHLDHIGVSIAATLAFQQAKHKPQALLFNLFKPHTAGTKWKYVFPEKLPASHTVDISQSIKAKVAAYQAHESQPLASVLEHLKQQKQPQELFQLAIATEKGKKLINQSGVFKKI